MSYGPSAHRAASDSSLALLVSQTLGQATASTGQHRQPVSRRRARREPQRALQMLMSGLAAVILLAICGLSGFFVIAGIRRGHQAEAAGAAPATTPALGSRTIDPTPLGLDEVFPGTEIRVVRGAPPYRIGLTNVDTDCYIAATGELGAALTDHSCSQVIRADMTAPYGGYQVTAGIFNLADEAGARQIGEQVGRLVETGRGTFASMSSPLPSTDPLHQPLAQIGWHERGHYLVYCVIARPDGQVVRDDDPYARRITVDLVESYLADQILGKRSTQP